MLVPGLLEGAGLPTKLTVAEHAWHAELWAKRFLARTFVELTPTTSGQSSLTVPRTRSGSGTPLLRL